MPVFQRQDLPKLHSQIDQGHIASIYLLYGERYLCREAAERLLEHLLPDPQQRSRQLTTIDGDREDPGQTLSQLRTYGLFAGRRVFRVMDSKLFFSKEVATTLWDKAEQAWAAQKPAQAGRLLARLLESVGLSPSLEEGEALPELAEERWRKLFGFAKPEGDLSWVNDCLAALPPQSSSAAKSKEAADLLVDALEAGLPAQNILVLVAEAVDKRKRLYKYIEKNGVILDLTVDTGTSAAARKDQEALLRRLVEETVAGFGKKIEPRALPVLLERVGFHPVAVVTEAEKLALYAGEEPVITLAALNELIGRTREEALYELTEAVAGQDLAGSLLLLDRLQESGMHALALAAGLRNFIKKLMLARAFQARTEPAYASGMQFPVFQKHYLPCLKKQCEPWPQLLAGHPFVVYKLFRQAEKFAPAHLKAALGWLLETEYRLKSSRLPAGLILQHFLFQFLLGGTESQLASTKL